MKRQKALDLRLQGQTFPMIAKALGCAVSEAWRLTVEGIKETYREEARELGTIEGEKMDLLERETRKAMNEAEPEQLPALLAILVRISERRAKLYGLDAPKKIEMSVPDKIEVVRVDGWGGAGDDTPAE